MKFKVVFIFIGVIIMNLILWPKTIDGNASIKKESNVPKELVITLKGEISYPGMYTFYGSVSLNEVLEYSPLLETTKRDNINFNEIYIADTTIIFEKLVDDEDNYPTNLKLNINKASFSNLIKVDGITDLRAANIILYREEHGPFKNLNELLKVKYIGESVYEKISPFLTV